MTDLIDQINQAALDLHQAGMRHGLNSHAARQAYQRLVSLELMRETEKAKAVPDTTTTAEPHPTQDME